MKLMTKVTNEKRIAINVLFPLLFLKPAIKLLNASTMNASEFHAILYVKYSLTIGIHASHPVIPAF